MLLGVALLLCDFFFSIAMSLLRFVRPRPEDHISQIEEGGHSPTMDRGRAQHNGYIHRLCVCLNPTWLCWFIFVECIGSVVLLAIRLLIHTTRRCFGMKRSHPAKVDSSLLDQLTANWVEKGGYHAGPGHYSR